MGVGMRRAGVRALRHLLSFNRRLARDEAGTLVTTVAVLPAFIGALALGVELGQVYVMKRQMQGAADAAALVASVDLLAGKSTSVISSDAQFEAQRNGSTNGANNVSVTVNSPPSSGPNVNSPGAVEVVVSRTVSLPFTNILNSFVGRSSSGVSVNARSVAAQGSYTQTGTNYVGCVVALTSATEQGVSFTSFNNYNSDCSIVSTGTATGQGSSASVNLSSFTSATLRSVWTSGSLSLSSYGSFNPQYPSQTNQTSFVVDPYAGLTTPTAGLCSYTNYVAPFGISLTLRPGTYCGGLSVTNKSNIAFMPGTYYIADGDLFLNATNNISCPSCTGGAGVTFVLTQVSGNNGNIGGVSITAGNTVTLSAPSSGTYQGLLFYQDRNVPTGTISSSSKIFTLSATSSATLNGAIYFPNNTINIPSLNNAGTSSSGCTVWIGRYIVFSGFNSNYIAGCSNYGTTPVGIQTTTLVSKSKVLE